MCCRVPVAVSRPGTISSPAVRNVITEKAIARPKNPECICCDGPAVFPCTSTGKSCGTLAARMKHGVSTFSTNPTTVNKPPRPFGSARQPERDFYEPDCFSHRRTRNSRDPRDCSRNFSAVWRYALAATRQVVRTEQTRFQGRIGRGREGQSKRAFKEGL